MIYRLSFCKMASELRRKSHATPNLPLELSPYRSGRRFWQGPSYPHYRLHLHRHPHLHHLVSRPLRRPLHQSFPNVPRILRTDSHVTSRRTPSWNHSFAHVASDQTRALCHQYRNQVSETEGTSILTATEGQ